MKGTSKMHVRGNHGLMAGAGMLLLAMLGVKAHAADAISQYMYEPDKIYVVRTGLGITTQIELSPNEEIRDYSTGFSTGWEISRRDNLFYIKPKNVDVDTNLMIRTATHAYIMELKVVATDWKTLDQAKQAGVQYKVKFDYPSDTEFTAKNRQVEESPELSTVIEKGRAYNYGYDYSSNKRSRWLAPVNVYDDGQFTYVRLNETATRNTGNFPAVFGREREYSDDFVVNTTVEGNVLVVHGVYPYLVIRHGDNAVGIRRNQRK